MPAGAGGDARTARGSSEGESCVNLRSVLERRGFEPRVAWGPEARERLLPPSVGPGQPPRLVSGSRLAGGRPRHRGR